MASKKRVVHPNHNPFGGGASTQDRKAAKLDVEAIRADLLGGEEIPGCRIEERGTHLRIK